MAALCRNPRILIVVALVAVGVLVWGPSPSAVLPLLLLLACPLGMVLMAGGMAGMARRGGTNPSGDAEVARLRAEVAELRANHTRSS
jgi:hypothetical protein